MSKYPIVKLGQYTYEVREQVGKANGSNLPVLGVTNIAGITVTGKKASEDLSKYIRLKHNYFAYNPYRINVGSIGLSEKQDGVVSPAYVVFTTKPELNPNYLFNYLKSQEGHQHINFFGNRGSVRQALRYDDLSKIEIPLPSLPEQQRIVAKLETLSAKINQAKELRRETIEEVEALLYSESSKVFDAIKAKTKNTELLENLSTRITKGESPHWQGFSYQDKGPIFITSENVLWNRLNLRDAKHIPNEFHNKLQRSKVAKGDVLINLVGASIGRAAWVSENIPEANVNQAVAVVTLKTDIIRPDYFLYFFFSPSNQKTIYGNQVDTARANISLTNIRELMIPLVSIIEQQKIVAYLDNLKAKIDRLKELQQATSAELAALMPSLLSKAFKSKL